jgi:hypothetical protein
MEEADGRTPKAFLRKGNNLTCPNKNEAECGICQYPLPRFDSGVCYGTNIRVEG